MSQVLVEGNVITLNQPQHLNALSPDLIHELRLVFELMRGKDYIIIQGAGTSFAAGADVKALQKMNRDEADNFMIAANETFDAIANSCSLVIAKIHGFTLGGGLELALACDLIVADPKTKLGFPEVKLDLLPGFGAFQRLPKRVGLSMAKKLLLTGEQLSAKEALDLGLIDHIGEIEIPPLCREIKRGFYHGDRDHFLEIFERPSAKEKMRAFVEKRDVKRG